MSLQVKATVDEGTNSFIVFDCTGDRTGSNLGGYGHPNYRKNQIAESYIDVQVPSDTESYPHRITVTGNLPNAENIGYEVQPSQVGQGSEMESGLYKVKLTHVFTKSTGGTEAKTAYVSVVLIDNITCCIDKHSKYLSGDIFKDEQAKKAHELHNLLESANMAICRGYYEEANKTIDYLKSQCKCNGCP